MLKAFQKLVPGRLRQRRLRLPGIGAPVDAAPDLRFRIEGDAFRDTGDWASAAEAYERHLQEAPKDFAIWVQLGHARKELGDLDRSLDAYLGAYALDTGDSDLLLNMGHLHKLRRDTVAAAYCYLLSVAVDDNRHAKEEIAHDRLGPALSEARRLIAEEETPDPTRFAAARHELSEAAAVDPAQVRALLAVEGDSHPLFDRDFYTSQLADPLPEGESAFDHYLTIGSAAGLDPHPLIDSAWYAERYGDVPRGMPALVHYLTAGWRQSHDPGPLFSTRHYSAAAKLTTEDGPALIHYLKQGRNAPSPHPAIRSDRAVATFAAITTPHDTALELVVATIGRAEARTLGMLDRMSPEDFGIRPEPLMLRAADKPVERIRAGAALASRDSRAARGGSIAEQAMLKLELLRADPAALADLNRTLIDAPGVEAAQAIAGFGILPLRVGAAPPGEHFPADGILSRYRERQLEVQRRFDLNHRKAGSVRKGPKISVLLPVYRTPIVYLERAIQSVACQTYANWELCIVDDCSGQPALVELLGRYAAAEPRIKVASARRNGGIAAATNQALEMATGDYVALLDHDDMLTLDALAKFAGAVVADPALDWVYSDECKIGLDDQPDELFTKPDWSPMLLTSVMYTAHLTMYRAALVRKVGGFRSEFDFSQDYDLALRIAETRPRVHHIREILYGWRMIPGSAAQGDKPEARATNIAALQSAMERRKWPGKAVALPSSNRAEAAFDAEPMVSIVIPSDNAARIAQAVMSVVGWTDYDNYEIIVVTRSDIAAECAKWISSDRVRFEAFDEPYNFSAKCNAGAAAAKGEYIVFHNDDVLVVSPRWLQALVEILSRPGVGAAGPKLLYENGRIQSAGMATGTRRLVGTAFHVFPRSSPAHFNFVQSVREVGVLSGACLAVSAKALRKVGGWDAERTPIEHSDVDLSLRLREAGLSCVYTPHAELIHFGHASIGEGQARKWDKLAPERAGLHLLKRFPALLGDDPYFPAAMRDLVYVDSAESYHAHLPTARFTGDGASVLVISHDLTNSGAPRVAADMAIELKERGCFVVLVSPADGPIRQQLEKAGIAVIVDALALTGHDTFHDFARNFDKVIANTVVAWRAVEQLQDATDVYWYLHESQYVDELVTREPALAKFIGSAKNVWAVSGRTAEVVRRYGVAPTNLETGIDDPKGRGKAPAPGGKVRIGVFGSFEPRKGQDVAAAAYDLIPASVRVRAELHFFGRDHDAEYQRLERTRWALRPGIHFNGEAKGEDYWRRMGEMEIVLVPSRDDPLPLVASDALALGKTLVLSDATGTREHVEDGKSAFVFTSEQPKELALLLERLIADPTLRASTRKGARQVYERDFTKAAFGERLVAAIGLGAPAPLETAVLEDAAE